MGITAWEYTDRVCKLIGAAGTVIGISVGLATVNHLVTEQRRQNALQLQQNQLLSQKAYNDLSSEYITYVRTCLNFTKLDCSEQALKSAPKLTETETIQQGLLYNMVFTILERAYVKYHDDDSSPEALEDWTTWDQWANNFVGRRSVQDAWSSDPTGYNDDFTKYFSEKIKAAQRNKAHP